MKCPKCKSKNTRKAFVVYGGKYFNDSYTWTCNKCGCAWYYSKGKIKFVPTWEELDRGLARLEKKAHKAINQMARL